MGGTLFSCKVDMLSKRSKAAESAFLSVFEKFASAPGVCSIPSDIRSDASH